MELKEAAARLEDFAGDSLTRRIAHLEREFVGATNKKATGFDADLLMAGALLKRVAGQVNVFIHAVGILIALPHILKPGEVVESLSLGAGNTGKDYDLVTNMQLAEFKFILWKGRDTIRQNSIFKDFYQLAEAETEKRRVLYLLELDRPLRFFRGRRALKSVLKAGALRDEFTARFGTRFERVHEYFSFRGDAVEIVDLTTLVPEIREIAQGLD